MRTGRIGRIAGRAVFIALVGIGLTGAGSVAAMASDVEWDSVPPPVVQEVDTGSASDSGILGPTDVEWD